MEIEDNMPFVFASFCDFEKINAYFIQFYTSLQNSVQNIDSKTLTIFHNSVNFVEKTGLMPVGIESIANVDLKNILLSISEIFCSKYLSYILKTDYIVQHIDEINLFYSVIVQLFKCFILEERQKTCLQNVLNTLCQFFESGNSQLRVSESEYEHILINNLRFLVKIIKCIPINDKTYCSCDIWFKLINSLPFSQVSVAKIFISHILPPIVELSEINQQADIFLSLWKIIKLHFKTPNENDSVETVSYIYSLLYCLSEYLYISKINTDNLFIHTEKVFWKMILQGLTSEFTYTRKKTLNIFKIFYMSVSKLDYKICQDPYLNLFVSQSGEMIKVWNDVIILFEVLEEKQVHVIKPVLSKFARILSLTSKENNVKFQNQEFDLPSAWITALCHRLLKHETKFVIKWTISTLTTLSYENYYFHEHDPLVFITLLIQSFNDLAMFSRNYEKENCPLFLSSDIILNFLENYLPALKLIQKVEFLKLLLQVIASQSWCIVALLHLILALTQIESIPAWDGKDLLHIRKIIKDCQRNQESLFCEALRSYLLDCCSLHLDWNNVNIDQLSELLINCKTRRSSKSWQRFYKFFRINFVVDSSATTFFQAAEFQTKAMGKNFDADALDSIPDELTNLEIEKLTWIIFLMIDSSTECESAERNESTWTPILNPFIELLCSASKRPYMNTKIYTRSLKTITNIFKLSLETRQGQSCSDDRKCILQHISDSPGIFESVLHLLFSSSASYSMELQYSSMEFFQVLSDQDELKPLIVSIVPKLIEKIQCLIDVEHQLRRVLLISLWKTLVVLVMNLFYKRNVPNFRHFNMNTVLSLNKVVLTTILDGELLEEAFRKPNFLEEIGKDCWLKFSYLVVGDFWDTATLVIKSYSHMDADDTKLIKQIAEKVEEALNIGGKNIVPQIINCMKNLLPTLGLVDFTFALKLLHLAWKTCLELRGSDALRTSLESFIAAVFQSDMLREPFYDILYEYIDRFKELSEGTSAVFPCMIKEFCTSFSFERVIMSQFNYIPLFVFALTYGPIHQKSHRLFEDNLLYFREWDMATEGNLITDAQCKLSVHARIQLLSYIFKQENTHCDHFKQFAFQLINALLQVDCDTPCTSQFANSFNHRIRNRAWQAIILLQSRMTDVSLNEELFSKYLVALELENQPSVRYLQEWVVFNLLKSCGMLLEQYLDHLENTFSKKPSFQQSILSVINLLILHGVIVDESKINVCFDFIIIMCMTQNFTVRIYAQVALMNLVTLCRKKYINCSFIEYKFLSKLLEIQTTLSNQGNFFKNVHKLSKDFYFSSFDPTNHFTLETIFFELPRLSKLAPDEWIKPSLFNNYDLCFPLYNSNENLKNCHVSFWSPKSTNATVEEDSSSDFNFQKKIISFRDNADMVDIFSDMNLNSKRPGLVVVASLIDRIPNLGGLCRTCEIFGVSEFVIGNYQITTDKQFQNLAVSADKWVRIKEVKPHHLKQYLEQMKEDRGYTLVGVEQTEDSQSLRNYAFPQKTLLLLGHEKEGLPTDLIQILDVCVEIPQQGVIRSLNVHVSGALLIWEYARQQSAS